MNAVGWWGRYRALQFQQVSHHAGPHSPSEPQCGNVFQTGTDLLDSTVAAFLIQPEERSSRMENELRSSHYAYGKYVGLS